MNQSREYYTSEYSARWRIPDYASYFEWWPKESATTRDELTCHLDLAYGAADKETLDLFPAANSTRLLVFLHGGYWRSMDKSDFSWIAAPLVKSGISVALPNYT